MSPAITRLAPGRTGLFFQLFVVFWCPVFFACSSEQEAPDPDKLSYRLEEVFWDSKFHPVDLDGDGRDERVRVSKDVPSREHDALILRHYEGQLIGSELGYSEQAKIVGEPHILDLDDDDVCEVLISVVRHDSLILSIVDGQTATEREQIFLAKGAPQPQGGGYISWDPKVQAVFREDVDRDGVNELVTVISTGYVSQPRGVFIHALDDRRLLDKFIMGVDPLRDNIFLGDFDYDDQFEIVFATGTPNTGGIAQGLDDGHTYLMAVNLTRPITEKWVTEKGGHKTDMNLLTTDFNEDGNVEFLAYKNTLDGRHQPTVLEFIDPKTGDPYLSYSIREPILDVEVVNLDHDTKANILALGQSGTLYVLNSELELVHRLPLPFAGALQRNAFEVLPDVDSDGFDEISVRIGSTAFLLSPDFRVKAVFPSGKVPYALLRPGSGQSPLLLTSSEVARDRTYVYRLTKNHLYLVNRYGPWMLWFVGIGLVLSLGIAVVALQRTRQMLRDGPQGLVAERSRAWRLMAQRVAHDLKNPLTSILLTSQRLQLEYHKQTPESAEQYDVYSKRIEDRIAHLRKMTRNLMKFVDLEEPALVDTDLNVFVSVWSASFAEDLPPDIHLTLKLAVELPFVQVDPEQMQSVLDNLGSNAIHAMPEGGTITLSTQVARRLEFATAPEPRDYVVLEVQDTGVGMPSEVQQRLFEVGFTTLQEGTGLGLAIVKKIVADHRGHIEVESEVGTGSAFSVYLPASL